MGFVKMSWHTSGSSVDMALSRLLRIFRTILTHLCFVSTLQKILFDSDSGADDGIIWHNPSTPLLRIHFLGWLFKHEFHQIFHS